MKIPLAWLKEYVDIDLPLIDLARLMTMRGLEVEQIEVIGLPLPAGERQEFKISGLAWDKEKFVVAQVDEVIPHPNADRLVLCRLNDGNTEQTVLTGAPNLYPYKGKGVLDTPLKVAYAREGAVLYDGHKPGNELTTLKRAKIRGIESYSMICSEKELGISEEHEGVIILDADAPTGSPLVDYMGDAVFEISILPNMIRNASLIGVAREIGAATNKPLHKPTLKIPASGPSVIGQASIKINNPSLNPRFVVGLVCGVEPRPSPYWVQRRLKLAGMRPINSIVDSTNYVMLETGQPLHAFDYDELVRRAAGKSPTIITRPAADGEILKTLDDVEHVLEEFTIVVADTAGSLSLAGVMGGEESEVTEKTTNVLLEGATWNMINIRRTISKHRIQSEAGYRFSRGVHPNLAPESVQWCLDRMAAWSGGEIAADLVDAYPMPLKDPEILISSEDVDRQLGIILSLQQIEDLLSRLEFECKLQGNQLWIKVPSHRMDIGEGATGKADLMEEIARLYGYDNIPQTRMADQLPVQRGNPELEKEEKIKEVLARLGLQEVITYRLTSPEREARILSIELPDGQIPYVELLNPIAAERRVMRRSLLSSVLEVVERNVRLRPSLAMFEIAPVFLPDPQSDFPVEQQRLVVVLSGIRSENSWDSHTEAKLDFYDMKGILEALFDGLNLGLSSFECASHPVFHPGKCARVILNGNTAGVMGELHPLVAEKFEFGSSPVLAAEIDLCTLFNAMPDTVTLQPVPVFPPVIEDLAIVAAEDIHAVQVFETIRKAAGALLADIQLFDVYQGSQVEQGTRSLAFKLTYQAQDRTLQDREISKLRQKIITLLEQELNAHLRK